MVTQMNHVDVKADLNSRS